MILDFGQKLSYKEIYQNKTVYQILVHWFVDEDSYTRQVGLGTQMVQQSVLLQLIQFVGLITPALAILIELLVRFHGGLDELISNKELPFEVQVLFLGFSVILSGGMVVGIQFALGLNDPVTQVATFLIFGGLPLLAISVMAINIRISGVSDPTSSLLDNAFISIRYASSIALPAILSAVLFFGSTYYFRAEINHAFNWWIFRGAVKPVWYFYALSAVSWYKSIYSLWMHSAIPTVDYTDAMGQWFVISFTIAAFLLIFSILVFGIYYALVLIRFPLMTRTSLLSAVPYLWGMMMALAVLLNEIDPN